MKRNMQAGGIAWDINTFLEQLQQLSYNYLSKVEDYKLIDNFNIKADIIIIIVIKFLYCWWN